MARNVRNVRKVEWKSGRVTWRGFYIDDTGKRRSETFDTQAEAKSFVARMEGDIDRGVWIDPDAGRQTFGEFADVEWAPAQDWKENTRQGWSHHRRRLQTVGLWESPLSSIDQLQLKRVQQRLRDRYAHTTTNTTMDKVRAILKAATLNGRIARNPAAGLDPLKRRNGETGEVTPDQVPTTAEALAILAGARSWYRAAVALGLAGLRVGEVFGLAVDRVDIERRLITVDQQLVRVNHRLMLTTPKNEKTRTIEVPALVAVELRRHLRDHVDRGRVFTGPGGPATLLFQGRPGTTPAVDPTQSYESGWRPALDTAGFDVDRFKFHGLRHFAASKMLTEGADIATVAGHLGDTVETVSRYYAHWLRDNRHVPADILDRVLAPEHRRLAVAR